jgi:hypothetical protein
MNELSATFQSHRCCEVRDFCWNSFLSSMSRRHQNHLAATHRANKIKLFNAIELTFGMMNPPFEYNSSHWTSRAVSSFKSYDYVLVQLSAYT